MICEPAAKLFRYERERRLLVTEGLEEGEWKFRGNERLPCEVGNGLLDFDWIHACSR